MIRSREIERRIVLRTSVNDDGNVNSMSVVSIDDHEKNVHILLWRRVHKDAMKKCASFLRERVDLCRSRSCDLTA